MFHKVFVAFIRAFCISAYILKQTNLFYIFSRNYWFTAPPPLVHSSVTCSLQSKDKLSEHDHKMQLTLKGDHQCALVIGPKAGTTLQKWDIVDELADPIEFNGQRGYFVLISSGSNPGPMNITLNLKV